MATTLESMWVKLGLDKSGFTRDIKVVKGETSGFKTFLNNAFSTAFGIGIFDAVRTGIKGVWDVSLGFNSQMQQNRIAFDTMLGSGRKAGDFLQWLQGFAASTPFEFTDLTDASKKLLAFGFSAKKIPGMLKSIGDASAGLGISGAEGLNRIGIALGQMAAKGKVQAGEMMQLTEAGIPAWDILAKAMGKSTAQVMKLSEKGLLPANKAIDMLVSGMESRFPNMMDKQSKSFEGLVSTIKDNVSLIAGQTLRGAFEWLSNTALPKLADALGAFQANFQKTESFFGSLRVALESAFGNDITNKIMAPITAMRDAFGLLKSVIVGDVNGIREALGPGFGLDVSTVNTISNALMGLRNGIIGAFGWLRDNGGLIATVILSSVTAMKAYKAVTMATMIVQEAQNAITALSIIFSRDKAAADAFMAFADKNASVAQWLLNAAMNANPIMIIVTLIAALVGAIIYLWNTNEGFRNALIGAWNVIRNTAMAVWNAIADFFVNIWNSILNEGTNIWNSVVSTIIGVFTGFRDGITSLANAIGQAVVNAFIWLYNHNYYFKALVDLIIIYFKALYTMGMNIWNSIKSFFTSVWNSIKNTATSVWMSISNSISSTWNNAITRIRNLVINLRTIITAVWSSISSYISGKAAVIKASIVNPFNAVKNVINGIISSAYSWGKNLIGNIVNGMRAMISRVASVARDVANAVKRFLGFHSPAKEGPGSDADQWAPNLMKMYTNGIKKGIPDISTAVNQTASILSRLNMSSQNLLVSAINSAANGSVSNTDTSPIIIQHMEVRNDQDINRIANKLYALIDSRKRAGGRK